jgi:hypothetical protein
VKESYPLKPCIVSILNGQYDEKTKKKIKPKTFRVLEVFIFFLNVPMIEDLVVECREEAGDAGSEGEAGP